MGKQTMIPGTMPKLGPVEKMLLSLVAVERDAAQMKDRAKKREKELIDAASKAGMKEVRALDGESGELHVFEIRAQVKCKRTTIDTVKVEKVEDFAQD